MNAVYDPSSRVTFSRVVRQLWQHTLASDTVKQIPFGLALGSTMHGRNTSRQKINRPFSFL